GSLAALGNDSRSRAGANRAGVLGSSDRRAPPRACYQLATLCNGQHQFGYRRSENRAERAAARCGPSWRGARAAFELRCLADRWEPALRGRLQVGRRLAPPLRDLLGDAQEHALARHVLHLANRDVEVRAEAQEAGLHLDDAVLARRAGAAVEARHLADLLAGDVADVHALGDPA